MDGSELLLSLAMDAAATRDISDKHTQHEPWLNIHEVSAQVRLFLINSLIGQKGDHGWQRGRSPKAPSRMVRSMDGLGVQAVHAFVAGLTLKPSAD